MEPAYRIVVDEFRGSLGTERALPPKTRYVIYMLLRHPLSDAYSAIVIFILVVGVYGELVLKKRLWLVIAVLLAIALSVINFGFLRIR